MHLKKKEWSVEEIIRQIHALHRQTSSPYNDGFTAFELKKDLYQIKETINRALEKSPKFAGEEEWLQEQEKKRIIKILKE